MTGITITQAALHAALLRVRREESLFGLDTLIDLLDPAPARPVTQVFTDPLSGRLAPKRARRDFHAPSLAAEEAQPAHRDHLPTLPGAAEIAGASGVEAGRAPPLARNTPPPAQAAGGPSSPPKPPWGSRPVCVWTPDRVAMLRERLPTCLDDAALLADLNALPAQLPISSVNSMRKQAVKIGVQREGAVIKQLMQAGARKGLSRANEERLKLIGEAPADAKPTKPRTYAMTAERLDALPALWADPNLTAGDIQARLNEMPGLRIANSTVLYGWAQRIGLSTHRPQPQDEAPAQPPPEPPPAPATAPPAEPAERTPEEQAAIADAAVLSKHDRAKAKLRQVLADKPKDTSMAIAGIAAGMKLPLREVMRLMGEVRNEGAAA